MKSCLTTWEAQKLSTWLHDVADGIVAPVRDGSDEGAPLAFTEPNLALSLEQRSNGRLRVRVHFSLEALPPWFIGANRPGLFEHFLVFDLGGHDLATAAAECDNDCASFPVR